MLNFPALRTGPPFSGSLSPGLALENGDKRRAVTTGSTPTVGVGSSRLSSKYAISSASAACVKKFAGDREERTSACVKESIVAELSIH